MLEAGLKLTFYQCIHSRVELFWVFFFLASKKKKQTIIIAARFFPGAALGWAASNFFVLFFLKFASPHSATHASILLYVYVCDFVCVYVLWCSH